MSCILDDGCIHRLGDARGSYYLIARKLDVTVGDMMGTVGKVKMNDGGWKAAISQIGCRRLIFGIGTASTCAGSTTHIASRCDAKRCHPTGATPNNKASHACMHKLRIHP